MVFTNNWVRYLIVIAFILPTTAKAESSRCQYPNYKLYCSTTYNFKQTYWKSRPGPSDVEENTDTTEIFDEPSCYASNLLYTAEGKLVVNFDENTKTIRVLKEYNGVWSEIISNLSADKDLKISTTIAAILKGDIKEIALNCEFRK